MTAWIVQEQKSNAARSYCSSIISIWRCLLKIKPGQINIRNRHVLRKGSVCKLKCTGNQLTQTEAVKWIPWVRVWVLKPEPRTWTRPTPAAPHAPVIKCSTNMLWPTPDSSGSNMLQVCFPLQSISGPWRPAGTWDDPCIIHQISLSYVHFLEMLAYWMFYEPIHRASVESHHMWNWSY